MSDRFDLVAAIALLSIEVGSLSELQNWLPVGSALEEIPNSISGSGGLSMPQIKMLRRWSAKWKLLSTQLRDFYVAEINEDGDKVGIVEAGLWKIFEGESRPPLTHLQSIALKRMWEDRYGYAPQMILCPKTSK